LFHNPLIVQRTDRLLRQRRTADCPCLLELHDNRDVWSFPSLNNTTDCRAASATGNWDSLRLISTALRVLSQCRTSSVLRTQLIDCASSYANSAYASLSMSASFDFTELSVIYSLRVRCHCCIETVQNVNDYAEDWEAEVPHRLGIGQPVIYSDISAVVEGWPNCVPDGLKWTMDLPLTSIPAQGRFTVQTSSTIPLGALVRPLLYGRLRMLHTHVQYCIYRPYLYKVLHFPEQASSEDIEKSLLCLKVPKTSHFLDYFSSLELMQMCCRLALLSRCICTQLKI
jgi:hypothetical protein